MSLDLDWSVIFLSWSQGMAIVLFFIIRKVNSQDFDRIACHVNCNGVERFLDHFLTTLMPLFVCSFVCWFFYIKLHCTNSFSTKLLSTPNILVSSTNWLMLGSFPNKLIPLTRLF